jgi:hypothetical protein
MSANFRLVDRDTAYLLPPSVDEWLPENHLARFVVEIVDELDISALERAYTGSGSDAYHPRMMLALLFYSYATGVFSSRKMEAATFESDALCGRQPTSGSRYDLQLSAQIPGASKRSVYTNPSGRPPNSGGRRCH